MSLLVRCPDVRGLNMCTLEMEPWASVLIIKVCKFQGVPQVSCVRALQLSIAPEVRRDVNIKHPVIVQE